MAQRLQMHRSVHIIQHAWLVEGVVCGWWMRWMWHLHENWGSVGIDMKWYEGTGVPPQPVRLTEGAEKRTQPTQDRAYMHARDHSYYFHLHGPRRPNELSTPCTLFVSE
ncbi:unnamed protein product [Ectocarpus sp. 12 AP-2014]